MTKIKFVNPFEALQFFNLISLTPSHTWEVYRVTFPQKFEYKPNLYNMEIVVPGQYLKPAKPTTLFKLEVTGNRGGELTYYDLCLFLYEKLKHYNKKILPFYWDRPAIVLMDTDHLEIDTSIPRVKVYSTHPFYSHYKNILKIDARIIKDLEKN